MIQLMDLTKTLKGLNPVTTSELYIGKSFNFHPQGLFSEIIFGALDTKERRENISYIDLNCKVLHPALRSIVYRLQRKLLDLISGEKKFRTDDNKNLIEDENGEIYGLTKFIEIFDDIKWRGESKARDDMISMLMYYRKKDMVFLDKCLVIPPKFRDVEILEDGATNIDPLNDYYINLLKLTEQIKSSQSGSMFDILSYKIFMEVLNLYNFLSSKITKKKGIIRSNILGKRTDFSARAVISGSAAELKIDEIGVPFTLLIKLFEPFILHVILYSGLIDKNEITKELYKYNEMDLNAFNIRKLFIGIYRHDDIPNSLRDLLEQAVNIAINDKTVLAKRDPALHTESVQAFKPILIHGNTIKLNPLKCTAFNADFDGDQIALYTPVTREAIQEVKEKMINSSSKDGYGQLGDDFNKDVAMGIYFMTKDSSYTSYLTLSSGQSVDKINDPLMKIKYKQYDTTVGRVLFNVRSLPEKYKFINKPVDRKLLNNIASDIMNNYSKEEYKTFCDYVLKLSFKYGTIMSRSFSFDDFKIPKYILILKEKLKDKEPEQAQKIIDQMTKLLQEYLEKKKGNLGEIGLAGGLKGGYDQARQILVAKGLIKDPTGKVMPPIAESYSEGMHSKSFFLSGGGSRAGIADRVLNTAETGYMSRQLVFATQRCEVDPRIKDCNTKRYLTIKAIPDIAKRLKGRNVVDGGKIVKFNYETMLNQMVVLRSPTYCLSNKICLACYGDLIFKNRSIYVGTTSSQSVGSLFTQAIMRTFHSGGEVTINTIDIFESISNYLDEKQLVKFRNIFKQTDDKLISNKSGKLVIIKSEYLNPTTDIKHNVGEIELAYGYLKIIIGDELFDLAIDTKTIINLEDKKKEEDDKKMIIEFSENSNIFSCPPESGDFGGKVKSMKHLFSGKKPWKSSDHLVLKIYDALKDLTGMDLVHFEVLASQLLRDKGNPMYPARLNKNYQPMVTSLKKIPVYESWLSSLSFENFNESITNGLMYDSDIGHSVLEKVVLGTL